MIRAVPTSVSDPKTYLSKPEGPARRVHIDQTPNGAKQFIGMLMPAEAFETITSSPRWMVINAWRPLKTIRKDAFAVMDARSVPESDLVPLKRIMPNGKEGENYIVKAGDEGMHKWDYLHEQGPEEGLALRYLTAMLVALRDVHRTPHSHTLARKRCLPRRVLK